MSARAAMVPRQMEERSQIANTLRAARERRELTIERAAADAGVPLRYVRLLEGEAPSGVGVSDELYLIPFFRRYAAALGLQAEELLPEFLGQVQELPAPPAGRPVPVRQRGRARALWQPLAVLLAIGAAVFVIVRQSPERPAVEDWSESERAARADALQPAPPTAAPPNAAAATAPTDVAGSAPGAGVVALPTASVAVQLALVIPPVPPTPSSAPTAVPPAASRELRIVAAQETWLSLGIDDEPKRSILLQPGETRSWTATRTFTLTVGNAGGITIALDGRELPPLGRTGQVVRNLRLPGDDTSPG